MAEKRDSLGPLSSKIADALRGQSTNALGGFLSPQASRPRATMTQYPEPNARAVRVDGTKKGKSAFK